MLAVAKEILKFFAFVYSSQIVHYFSLARLRLLNFLFIFELAVCCQRRTFVCQVGRSVSQSVSQSVSHSVSRLCIHLFTQ